MFAKRPDLARATSRLAADNNRIEQFIESLPTRLDAIVDAAIETNWPEVRRQGQLLSAGDIPHGYESLAESAKQLVDAMNRKPTDLEIKQSVQKIVGAYHDARQSRGE